MGSPLGPMLADFFVAKLESGLLPRSIETLPIYLRYVDDTFIVADERVQINQILSQYNIAHPAIKFTVECEKEDKISFLDVLLTRRYDGTLQRAIHRKPTW